MKKARVFICPVYKDGVPALSLIRRERGLTQEQLAEMAGVVSATIIGYERGNHTTPNNSQKIAEVLGVVWGDLWYNRVASAS